MSRERRSPQQLVLVGGGHSHVQVVKAVGREPPPGTRVTLLSREPEASYSGMLPGLVAGHYDHDEAHIDLRRLCRWADVRLVEGEARGLDLEERRVLRADGSDLSFDVLSLNVGGVPAGSGAPEVREHAVPVKPMDRFLKAWRDLAERTASAPGPVRVAVVGGGAGGVELALAVRHRLRGLVRAAGGDPDGTTFAIHTDGDRILEDHSSGVRSRMERILDERGVEVHTGERVTSVVGDGLRTDAGTSHPADRVLWVTGVTAPAWVGRTGLDTDTEGFVRVDAALRSTSHPFVFAAGDVARVVPHPRPRSGVFAVRQGPPLTRNLRSVLAGDEPEGFEPQERFLSLISTGDRYAVGSYAFLAFEGRWVWWLKDWIDRRWMARFSDLDG